ncbi:23S rRNA (pseudouridine(1915)-N(3))-methyltransferase RlmH [soil metagenome]
MRVIVAVVGKPKDPSLAAAIAEYEKRAARYWPLEVVEVREESGRGASPAVVMKREGERLRERIGEAARAVVCDPGGRSFDSRQFASWMQAERESGRDFAFVVGGAHGVSAELRDEARVLLSLAPWTLPHELARLVLAEQLYRAGTIVRGEPYHK